VANPQVIVDFIADTSRLNKGFSDAGAGATGFGSKVKGLAKAGVVAAGAAGLAALTATLKIGVDEFTNAAKVSAQTEAVIKSTGGAAGVTAKQVDKLATSMMKKTGVDDETIKSGENVLLTFTRIQNKAGKGNDIFNQATKATLDLSVALGQDMQSSAIQVGKALNDPIKGITALQRVGVSFTDAQKKQVKAMVESGDVMGAQKLILAELTKEFGGSAEAAGKTLPGQINILKESFSNLAGTLVGTLAPALSTVTKFLVDNPAIAKAMVVGVLALAAAMVTLNAALAISAVVTAGLLGPIALVIAAIAAFIAIGVLLAKNWGTVTAALSTAFAAIKTAAMSVFNWLRSNWPLLLGILTGPVGAAVVMIATHWATVKSVTQAAWNAVKGATSDAWNAVRGVVQGAVNTVSNAVTGAWNAVKGATAAAWGAVESKVTSVIGSVKGALSAFAGWVSGFAHGALSAAVNAAANVFDKITAGAHAAVAGVKNAMNAIVSAVEAAAGAAGRAAASVANAIKAPINAVLSAWNKIKFSIPKIEIPSVTVAGKKIGGGSFGGQSFGVPNVPLLARGGVFDTATLAVVGEAGREIVTPESLLRQIMGEQPVEVHVYIGDRELTDLVRAEVVDVNTGIARTILAGTAA
jgi:phage-related protein